MNIELVIAAEASDYEGGKGEGSKPNRGAMMKGGLGFQQNGSFTNW